MKTDDELKQLLAKMLPEQIAELPRFKPKGTLVMCGWLVWKNHVRPVLDSELLHVCWLIEQTLPRQRYSDVLKSVIMDDPSWHSGAVEARYETARASWQQRTMALAQVKGLL